MRYYWSVFNDDWLFQTTNSTGLCMYMCLSEAYNIS